MNIKIKSSILFLSITVLSLNLYAQDITVGNTLFVHLKKINNVWWFVDANGEKFISTGMNHMQANIRFADYNKAYWAEKFGKDILQNAHICILLKVEKVLKKLTSNMELKLFH